MLHLKSIPWANVSFIRATYNSNFPIINDIRLSDKQSVCVSVCVECITWLQHCNRRTRQNGSQEHGAQRKWSLVHVPANSLAPWLTFKQKNVKWWETDFCWFGDWWATWDKHDHNNNYVKREMNEAASCQVTDIEPYILKMTLLHSHAHRHLHLRVLLVLCQRSIAWHLNPEYWPCLRSNRNYRCLSIREKSERFDIAFYSKPPSIHTRTQRKERSCSRQTSIIKIMKTLGHTIAQNKTNTRHTPHPISS